MVQQYPTPVRLARAVPRTLMDIPSHTRRQGNSSVRWRLVRDRISSTPSTRGIRRRCLGLHHHTAITLRKNTIPKQPSRSLRALSSRPPSLETEQLRSSKGIPISRRSLGNPHGCPPVASSIGSQTRLRALSEARTTSPSQGPRVCLQRTNTIKSLLAKKRGSVVARLQRASSRGTRYPNRFRLPAPWTARGISDLRGSSAAHPLGSNGHEGANRRARERRTGTTPPITSPETPARTYATEPPSPAIGSQLGSDTGQDRTRSRVAAIRPRRDRRQAPTRQHTASRRSRPKQIKYLTPTIHLRRSQSTSPAPPTHVFDFPYPLLPPPIPPLPSPAHTHQHTRPPSVPWSSSHHTGHIRTKA